MKRTIFFLVFIILGIGISSFFIYMSYFAQGVNDDAQQGKNKLSNLDSILSLDELTDTNQTNESPDSEFELEYGYNAETSHIFALPKNIEEKNTEKYDSSIFYTNDNSLIIKKWTYKNLYPNIYKYPKTELGDIDINQIDTTLIGLIFNKICDSLKTTLSNSIQTIKSNSKELILNEESKDSLKMYKLMLCNVIGGTHAITAITIKADTSNRLIGKKILLESIPK